MCFFHLYIAFVRYEYFLDFILYSNLLKISIEIKPELKSCTIKHNLFSKIKKEMLEMNTYYQRLIISVLNS